MIVRVARREKYLQAILEQVRDLAGTGLKIHVLFSYDRPSPEVCLTLEAIKTYPKKWLRGMSLHFLPAPAPILSDQGERWMQVLQAQYTQLLDRSPVQACMLWDDDMLFPPRALAELVEQFRDPPDRVEARTLFLWDTLVDFNASIPEHWSAVWFRVYPGDTFPEDYVVHCPEATARSPRVARLAHPVVNFGYLTSLDREIAWCSQKEAGKIDAHTLCLQRPPSLAAVPEPYVILPTRKSTRYAQTF